MNKVFPKLKGGLIVSCQAQGKSPFNSPNGVSLFAKTAVMSGAIGIRSEGAAKTKAIVRCVNVPVIGLIKSEFPDGTVRITGSMRDVAALVKTGCHIIAIDGTLREREGRAPFHRRHVPHAQLKMSVPASDEVCPRSSSELLFRDEKPSVFRPERSPRVTSRAAYLPGALGARIAGPWACVVETRGLFQTRALPREATVRCRNPAMPGSARWLAASLVVSDSLGPTPA